MREYKILPGYRIWPREKWPLVNKAMRIYKARGMKGYKAWRDGLSALERSEFYNQFFDLLRAGARKAAREFRKRGE